MRAKGKHLCMGTWVYGNIRTRVYPFSSPLPAISKWQHPPLWVATAGSMCSAYFLSESSTCDSSDCFLQLMRNHTGCIDKFSPMFFLPCILILLSHTTSCIGNLLGRWGTAFDGCCIDSCFVPQECQSNSGNVPPQIAFTGCIDTWQPVRLLSMTGRHAGQPTTH